jgi:hypothetical protein
MDEKIAKLSDQENMHSPKTRSKGSKKAFVFIGIVLVCIVAIIAVYKHSERSHIAAEAYRAIRVYQNELGNSNNIDIRGIEYTSWERVFKKMVSLYLLCFHMSAS